MASQTPKPAKAGRKAPKDLINAGKHQVSHREIINTSENSWPSFLRLSDDPSSESLGYCVWKAAYFAEKLLDFEEELSDDMESEIEEFSEDCKEFGVQEILMDDFKFPSVTKSAEDYRLEWGELEKLELKTKEEFFAELGKEEFSDDSTELGSEEFSEDSMELGSEDELEYTLAKAQTSGDKEIADLRFEELELEED